MRTDKTINEVHGATPRGAGRETGKTQNYDIHVFEKSVSTGIILYNARVRL